MISPFIGFKNKYPKSFPSPFFQNNTYISFKHHRLHPNLDRSLSNEWPALFPVPGFSNLPFPLPCSADPPGLSVLPWGPVPKSACGGFSTPTAPPPVQPAELPHSVQVAYVPVLHPIFLRTTSLYFPLQAAIPAPPSSAFLTS